MRNLKKLLALVVAICVIATFTAPAFAADAAAAAPSDSKICSDLGVLQGDGNGVSDTYLAKGTTRLQAAILYLRLLGKEDEALAETSTDNFSDAKDLAWAEGRNVLAYLKKNPSLGWQGDGVKFTPNSPATAQMIYKVMLVGLGYVEGTDFQYAEAVSYAGGKGLTKVAYTTTITNNDMAIALVEALKANIKDGSKTFAADLVAKNIITAAAADATGLVPAYKPVALDVKSVSAITNTKVDIALNTAAAKADLDAAVISVKDAAGTALAVSSSTLSADGKTVTVVTAAQTPGTVYKMTIGTAVGEFVGLVADTTKPTLDGAVAQTNTSVKLTFSEDVDAVTGAVAANYTIAGLTVTAAAVDGATVTLTTPAQTSGKLYEVVVANVTDKSANVINSDNKSKKFGGKAADTTKPAIKAVVSEKGNTVKVTYTEAEMLNDDALTVANYTINNDVTVLSAAFATGDTTKNALGNDVQVILKTSTQVNGKLYKLTVKNVTDKAGNKIDDVDKSFGGTPLDTTKIGIDTAVADTNTKVIVTLDDSADAATVLPANFTIDGGLTVTAASVDGATVTLTTSAQTSGKLYTLTIANLKDLAGNAVNTDKNTKKFGGKAADTDKPTINSVVAIDQTTVKVTYNEKVDEASAETLSNYVFDGGLLYPTKATLDDGKMFVTLKTLAQASKVYSLKISNVKDLSGNVIEASSEKKFAGVGDALGKVKLETAYAVDKQTIKLIFNQALDATQAAAEANYSIKSGTNSGTNIGATAGALVSATDAGARATLGGDDKEVTITFPAAHYMNSTELYTITIQPALVGKYGAALDTDNDEQQFAGLDSAKADLAVDMVNVVDGVTLEVVFNQNISSPATVLESDFVLYTAEGDIPGGANTGASLVGVAAGDRIDGNKLKITLADGPAAGAVTKLADNTVYYLEILATNAVKDISGIYDLKIDNAADKSEAVFATGSVADVAVKVDAAVMTDDNTVNVYFNNDINAATFNPATDVAIKKGGTEVAGIVYNPYFFYKDKVLTLYFTGATLVNGDVYTVEFDANQARIAYKNDGTKTLLAAAAAEQKTEFAALDTDNAAPSLISASAVADNKVKLTFSEALSGLADTDLIIYNQKTATEITDATFDLAAVYAAGDADTAGDTEAIIQLAAGGKFEAGTTYEVVVKSASVRTDSAAIGNLKEDDAATATTYENSVTFTGPATTIAGVTDADLAKLGIIKDAGADTNYELADAVALSGADKLLEVTLNNGTTWIPVGLTAANGNFTATDASILAAAYVAGATPKYRYKDSAMNVSAASNADGVVAAVASITLTNAAGVAADFDGAADTIQVAFTATVTNTGGLAIADFTSDGTLVASTPTANAGGVLLTWAAADSVADGENVNMATGAAVVNKYKDAGGNVVKPAAVAPTL